MQGDRFARMTKQQLMGVITADGSTDEERSNALCELIRRDVETGSLMTKMFDEGGDAKRIEAILDREDLTPEQQAEIVAEAVDLTRFSRGLRDAIQRSRELGLITPEQEEVWDQQAAEAAREVGLPIPEEAEEEATPEEQLLGRMVTAYTDYINLGGKIADLDAFLAELSSLVRTAWLMFRTRSEDAPEDGIE